MVDPYKYNKHANHYLVIGPYDDLSTEASSKPPVVEGYSIDPVAQIDTVKLTYRWFDYLMRVAPAAALFKDQINYEVMGANPHRSLAKLRDLHALARRLINEAKRCWKLPML